MNNFKVNDYVEGIEVMGIIGNTHERPVKGWVKGIFKDHLYLQINDNWHGARGSNVKIDTVKKLDEQPTPPAKDAYYFF